MNKFYTFFGALAVLLVAGTGCSSLDYEDREEREENTPVEEVSEAPSLKFGVMVPLTGDAASYGNSVKNAVMLAKKEAGADHVELVFADSKCEGKDAAAEVQKLISVNKVDAIIGELCSDATKAAVPIAEAAKVPMVSPASTAPDVTSLGSYIVRTVPSDALQGAFGAKLVSDKGLKKLAVLYVNNDYGVGFNDVLKREMPNHGGEVVVSEAVEKQSVDMRTQLTKIKAAGPDALYIISNSPDTAGAALKQTKELGLEVTVFGSEGLKSQDVLDAAQGAAEGVLLTTVSGGSQTFVDAHKAEYGEDPGPFAAQAYDAFKALFMASEQAFGEENDDTVSFIDALMAVEFEGASGNIKFNETGDVQGNYIVFTVKDGAFVLE